MLNKTAFPFRREPQTDRKPVGIESLQDFPDLPVLPETLLFLDLMLQEPCINLREMSQLVLSDLGATVQIMRLAGREYGNSEGRPVRIEDCIADLGLAECLEAVARKTLPRDDSAHDIAELWAHAREIGHQARMIAEDTVDVSPDEAYLAGLLHVIGLLPQLLGWRKTGVTDGMLAGLVLSKRWCLPECVSECFREVSSSGYLTRIPAIVHQAHELAGRTTIPCPMDRGPRLTMVDDFYLPPGPTTIQ